MKTYYITGAALIAVFGMGFASVRADAQTSYPRPHEVNGRLANQNARIKQGVKSGELTKSETRNLRTKDATIHYQEQVDRIDHNGHLTSGESKQLNRELNHSSAAIYRDKHNSSVR